MGHLAKLYLWNNPLTAHQFSATVEFATGKVWYQTNNVDGHWKEYECFFLCPLERLHTLALNAAGIVDWNGDYDKGIMIDGFYWKVIATDVNGEICERFGNNSKPEGFDGLVTAFEYAIQKPLTVEEW